jgi:hypothetical protein
MNHGVIERVEYHFRGDLHGQRAYMRIWVTGNADTKLCWVDVEATNMVIKKRQRISWQKRRVYVEQSPSKRLVELKQLGYGEPEGL